MAILDRWGLAEHDIREISRPACRFHQDFDVEGLSFREAFDREIRFRTAGERQLLRGEARFVLERIPSESEFDRFFVAAGAEP